MDLEKDIFKIIRPGLLTLLQDAGRIGKAGFGISFSGPMDPFAMNLANDLVGNPTGYPSLEITFQGPILQALKPALIALTGSEVDFKINGQSARAWATILVQAGDIIEIGNIAKGCRCYLAVDGGLVGEQVMDSFATYLPAAMGGFKGQQLKKQATLKRLENPLLSSEKHLYQTNLQAVKSLYQGKIAIILNTDMADNILEQLISNPWRVSPDSNRIGIRLTGNVIRGCEQEQLSTGVGMGIVQLPPNGEPIILGADAQTIGGYPILGKVIRADFCKLGQLKAGDDVLFTAVTQEDAYQRLVEQRIPCKKFLSQTNRQVVFTNDNYYDITIEGEGYD